MKKTIQLQLKEEIMPLVHRKHKQEILYTGVPRVSHKKRAIL